MPIYKQLNFKILSVCVCIFLLCFFFEVVLRDVTNVRNHFIPLLPSCVHPPLDDRWKSEEGITKKVEFSTWKNAFNSQWSFTADICNRFVRHCRFCFIWLDLLCHFHVRVQKKQQQQKLCRENLQLLLLLNQSV